MNTANFITFESLLPDDSVYSSSGDVEIPDGKNLAASIQQALNCTGLKVSEPAQHSFYGWRMNVEDAEDSFSLLLQCPGPWLLICEIKTFWLTRFWKGNKALEAFSRRVASSLTSVSAISSISVQTQEAFLCRENADTKSV
jgi:hypothetical protein